MRSKLVAGATFTDCPNKPNGCGNGSWTDGESRAEAHPHGTHVAGIAAAATIIGIGIAGVARAAKRAINYAVSKGVVVVAAAGNEFASLVFGCKENIISTVPRGREERYGQVEKTPGYDFYVGTSMAYTARRGRHGVVDGPGARCGLGL